MWWQELGKIGAPRLTESSHVQIGLAPLQKQTNRSVPVDTRRQGFLRARVLRGKNLKSDGQRFEFAASTFGEKNGRGGGPEG